MIEQIERLAAQYDWGISIYSQRVQDVANLVASATQPNSASRLIWHKVSTIPGPHLLQFCWWFLANTLSRWRARSSVHRPAVTYSAGINCFDADAIVVHIVFHEFYARVRPELRFRNLPVRNWPVTLHRLLYYRLIMSLERRIYTNPRIRLAAVSQLVSDQLHTYFHRNDVVLIPNAVDTKRFDASTRLARRDAARSAFGFSPTDFVLLLIGNDWKKKGLDTILRAIRLNAELPLHLLVVGRDDPAPYRSLLSQLGGQNRVRFLPPSADVLQFYAAADAYVGPSLEDAFGLPVLEAMACGLPVISSVRAGVSSLIENEINGLLLRHPESAEELAVFILRLASDQAFRQRLGQAGLRTAVGHTWDHNAAMTHDFLLGASHSRRS